MDLTGPLAYLNRIRVTVQTSSATPDLLFIQQNLLIGIDASAFTHFVTALLCFSQGSVSVISGIQKVICGMDAAEVRVRVTVNPKP